MQRVAFSFHLVSSSRRVWIGVHQASEDRHPQVPNTLEYEAVSRILKPYDGRTCALCGTPLRLQAISLFNALFSSTATSVLIPRIQVWPTPRFFSRSTPVTECPVHSRALRNCTTSCASVGEPNLRHGLHSRRCSGNSRICSTWTPPSIEKPPRRRRLVTICYVVPLIHGAQDIYWWP